MQNHFCIQYLNFKYTHVVRKLIKISTTKKISTRVSMAPNAVVKL